MRYTITVVIPSIRKYNSTNAMKELVLKIGYKTDRSWKLISDTLDFLVDELKEASTPSTSHEEEYYTWAYLTHSSGIVTGGNFKIYPNEEIQSLSLDECLQWLDSGLHEWFNTNKFYNIVSKTKKEEEYFLRVSADIDL